MAYTAWSVVYGEQPTAAKWNQLGANDAGFKDMTNVDNDAVIERHIAAGTLIENIHYQTDNSNSISSTQDAKVQLQMGWAQAVGNNTQSFTAAVTFPQAFTTVLGVVCQLNNVKAGSAASSITDLDSDYNTSGIVFAISSGNVSTTGFDANISRSSASFANTTYYGFSWVAWGIV